MFKFLWNNVLILKNHRFSNFKLLALNRVLNELNRLIFNSNLTYIELKGFFILDDKKLILCLVLKNPFHSMYTQKNYTGKSCSAKSIRVEFGEIQCCIRAGPFREFSGPGGIWSSDFICSLICTVRAKKKVLISQRRAHI